MKLKKICALLSFVLIFALCAPVTPVLAGSVCTAEISYPAEAIGTGLMDTSEFKTGMPYWRQFENPGDGVAEVAEDPLGSGEPVIHLKGAAATSPATVLRSFFWAWCTPQDAMTENLDSVRFDMRFLYTGNDQQNILAELGNLGADKTLWIKLDGGRLVVGETVTGTGVPADVWNDLTIYFDFTNRRFRAYLNGFEASDGVQPITKQDIDITNPVNELALWRFPSDASNPSELYIESISISNEPNQNILVGSAQDGIVNSQFPTSTFTIHARTPLDPESVTLDKFEIDGGAYIEAARLVDNNSSIELDLCDLKPGTGYSVNVKDGITTEDGDPVGASEWSLSTLPRANYSDIKFTNGAGEDISQTGLVTGATLNMDIKFYDYSPEAGHAMLVMGLYNNEKMVKVDVQVRDDIVRNVPADFQLSFDVPAAAEGDNYKAVLYFLHPTSIQPFLNPIVLEPGKAYYTRP